MSLFKLASALRIRRRGQWPIYRDAATLDDRTLVDIGFIRAELRTPGREYRLGPLVSLAQDRNTI